jgi:hypothetical protein
MRIQLCQRTSSFSDPFIPEVSGLLGRRAAFSDGGVPLLFAPGFRLCALICHPLRHLFEMVTMTMTMTTMTMMMMMMTMTMMMVIVVIDMVEFHININRKSAQRIAIPYTFRREYALTSDFSFITSVSADSCCFRSDFTVAVSRLYVSSSVSSSLARAASCGGNSFIFIGAWLVDSCIY